MAGGKKKTKWVRLSNGTVEKDDGVGRIMLDLRSLAVNHPSFFEAAARFVAEGEEPPDFVAAKLREMKFAKGGDPLVLYDDVRDVIECCTDWSGRFVRFDSANLLHTNQADVIPPEGED